MEEDRTLGVAVMDGLAELRAALESVRTEWPSTAVVEEVVVS